jgi:glycosyltransferase involved in cell wall biosynthesis
VLTAAGQLMRYIREHRVQVVHSFDAPLNAFGVPVARLAGTPAVISSQRGHRDLTGRTLKHLLRFTDRIADAVVVNCQAMKQYMTEEEHVRKSKVHLCYNAVDTSRYQRRPTNPLFPGRFVIGSVSALRPEKGLDTLLRAFASVRDLGARLLIVGSGPEESKLRNLAADLGMAGDCHFEPATADVVNWLSQIDIFVLPSRSEALSNALMEAMSCGCCCVASRVGGNPELVEDGKTGLLFAPDNVAELAARLRQLLTDQSQRGAFAAAAAARMSGFSCEVAGHTMQTIYESVLNSKRPALHLSAKRSV